MANPLRPASLKVRALQWLAQREHSPQELRLKLLRAAAGRRPSGGAAASAAPEEACGNASATTAVEVDALLDWLATRGHLSAQRFVDSRIHSRQSRFGNQRIRQELRQHGLAPDAAAQAALGDSESARAREVWQRKYGVPARDAAGRVRQMRFLAGRGFSAEVVRQVLRQVVRDHAVAAAGEGSGSLGGGSDEDSD